MKCTFFFFQIVLSTGGNKVSDLSVAIELPKETLSLAADQMSKFPARVQFTVYQNDKFFKVQMISVPPILLD